MIMAMVWASPTREVGIASHLVAAAACGAAWARGVRSDRAIRLPFSIGLLELFLVLDAAFNWRWIVHGYFANAAMEQHLYGERKLPQELLLALLCAITMVAIVVMFQYFRGRPGACLTTCGALISVAFWAIEVISLHASDAILQHGLGPVMLVALAWTVSSSLVVIGILWDIKSQA